MSVMSFFFLFAACYALLAIALALTGLDFVTAISGAAAAIANVGPGFGDTIGHAGNFASLPDSAKLLMSRSEEHTSELQSLMRISYAVFCVKKKKKNLINNKH